MKTFIIFILSCLTIPLVFTEAAEVDNFTKREAYLEDATEIVNRAANYYMDKAISSANRLGKCSKKRLYRKIKFRFRDQITDKFSHFIYNSELVPKRRIKISESIYQDFSTIDSFIMGGLGKLWDTNAPVVRIGKHQIGADKFEHFFGMGYFYFKKHYLKGRPLKDALKIGLDTETGILGKYMTGVISSADLAANFKGMHFWNHLLLEGPDYLTFKTHPGPYIQCQNGKWKRTKDIDLSIYVDDGMDEAVNCSTYKNEEMAKSVKKRFEHLSISTGKEITCPIDPELLNPLKDIYGKFAGLLIRGL